MSGQISLNIYVFKYEVTHTEKRYIWKIRKKLVKFLRIIILTGVLDCKKTHLFAVVIKL